MTRVEFLQAVVDNAITEEVQEYAKVRLDKANAEKSKRSAESADKRAVALANLTEDWQTAKEVAESTEYSARTIQYYLGVLVKDGEALKQKGEKVMEYKLA